MLLSDGVSWKNFLPFLLLRYFWNLLGNQFKSSLLKLNLYFEGERDMEKILGMAKVTSKGSTTIPVAVRKKFNIREGDSILFIERDGELILRRA